MTDCTAKRIGFALFKRRCVEASFSSRDLSGDDALLLMREGDRRLRLIVRVAKIFHDPRDPRV